VDEAAQDVAPVNTVSIGMASYPADARTTDELLERAEWAARAAKRLGRNRVISLTAELASWQSADSGGGS
jgi:GGDEF domain-containing protein